MRILVAVVFDLFDPTIDVAETHWVSDTVGQNDGVTAFVETFGDGAEPLLASSVPNVEHSPKFLCLNFFDFEVDAHRAHVLLLEVVLGVPHHYGGLAHSAIPHDQVLVFHLRLLH
jgi:hypothetical protein